MPALDAINWGAPSWDFIILLFLVVASVIFGLSLGRQRTVVTIVSVYMALAVEKYAPVAEQMLGDGIAKNPMIQAVGFLALFVLVFFLFSHAGLMRNLVGNRGEDGAWYHSIILAFTLVGLMIAAVISYLPPSALDQLSDNTKRAFATPEAQLIWHVVPLVAMTIVGKKLRRRRRNAYEADDV
jgi:hypothetical protein